jgi:hypothetical protein
MTATSVIDEGKPSSMARTSFNDDEKVFVDDRHLLQQ